MNAIACMWQCASRGDILLAALLVIGVAAYLIRFAWVFQHADTGYWCY